MGMFKVAVTVSNPNGRERTFRESFWVDTAAIYSIVPDDRLAEIGVRAISSRDIVLADGRRERRGFGEAVLDVEGLGEALTCPLLFGPRGSIFLLGATALEAFGVDADPVEKRLKPVAAIIGGFLASRRA